MINLLVAILVVILFIYAVSLLPIAHREVRIIVLIVAAILALVFVARFAGVSL